MGASSSKASASHPRAPTNRRRNTPLKGNTAAGEHPLGLGPDFGVAATTDGVQWALAPAMLPPPGPPPKPTPPRLLQRRGSSIDLSSWQRQRSRRANAHESGDTLAPLQIPLHTSYSATPSISTAYSRGDSLRSRLTVKFPSGGSLQRRLVAMAHANRRGRPHRSMTSYFGSGSASIDGSVTPRMLRSGLTSPAETYVMEDCPGTPPMRHGLERRPTDNALLLGAHGELAGLASVDSESDALDRLHYLVQTCVFDGTYHHIPLQQLHLSQVLDVGCGTGIWTLELTQQWAHARNQPRFHAIDSRRLHPVCVHPANVVFHGVSDARDKVHMLPFPAGQFDLVRSGLDPCLTVSLAPLSRPSTSKKAIEAIRPDPVTSREARLADMVRVTRPGGWLELVVSDWTVRSDAYLVDVPESSQKVSAWLRALQSIPECDDVRPKDNSYVQQLVEIFREQGCDRVDVTLHKIPFGSHKADPKCIAKAAPLWSPGTESVAVWRSLLMAAGQRRIYLGADGDPMQILENWDTFTTMLREWDNDMKELEETPGLQPQWWAVWVVTAHKQLHH